MHLLVDCSAQFTCEFGDALAVGFLSKFAGDRSWDVRARERVRRHHPRGLHVALACGLRPVRK
jgi:hypothetical protein